MISPISSNDICRKFFDFFIKNGHTRVESSSLIPAQDNTLLFANAGMNQFKDIFLGLQTRNYSRAVTIQKCIRAGGKHNDLDNVGFTKRHLTFFEMMGNFSFGDYFKNDAIKFAWDFLTKEIGLPIEKLYASVYELDDEAYEIWNKEIGLPANRIVKLGQADNFWQMGEFGPCGPCSEIYIDRGLVFGCGQERCLPGCSCDRFLEIWNLVFMQFDRQASGDKSLKNKGVDTGMGLERLCSVVQNKESVFETDIFEPILLKIEQLTNISYKGADISIKSAFRVVADHIRSSSFAICDGVMPSNEGRGYVLRKIIRRAALFAQRLSGKNILPEIVSSVVFQMSSRYPELKERQDYIMSILKGETEKFSINLLQGQSILSKFFDENQNSKLIDGFQSFKLYDTYGFPLELILIIANENGFKVDIDGFNVEMEKQRAQSGKKISKCGEICELGPSIITEFVGYEKLQVETEIIAIMVDNVIVDMAPADTTCFIITKESPFYVECGGQINDSGIIQIASNNIILQDLKKIGNAIAAQVTTPINLKVHDKVVCIVDKAVRTNTMKNHTATHLLQAALMKILGKSIRQAGSVVTPDYLRFDFTCSDHITQDRVKEIEDYVNAVIMENILLEIKQTTYQKASQAGVTAFFQDKYNPENVRVVEILDVSAELCGGTHVKSTGDIGCFKITENNALSAGVRRFVAVTGPLAVVMFQKFFNTVKAISIDFKVTMDNALDSVLKEREEFKKSLNLIKKLKEQNFSLMTNKWISSVENISGINFLYLNLKDYSVSDLKDIAANILQQSQILLILTSNLPEGNVFYVYLPEISKIDFKRFSEFLKSLGFVGGGAKNTLQGKVSTINAKNIEDIKNWLKNI